MSTISFVETRLRNTVDALIVLDASEESRRRRLMRTRALGYDDIQARMEAQASREELLERADIVVANDGSVEDLAIEADRVWAELVKRRDAQAVRGGGG